MSDKPLTERVRDAPTIRQHVGDFFAKYVALPVAAATAIATFVGAPVYLTWMQMHHDDVAYCYSRIPGDWTSEARVDPTSIQGPNTHNSCAELFTWDEAYQSALEIHDLP